jgi:hypothetical protein
VKTEEIDGAGFGSATAKCKSGTRAVSGGFQGEFDADAMGTPLFLQFESRRQGKRRWTGSAYNAPPVEGDLTTYAYCGEEKLKTKSRSVDVDGAPDSETATAKCPKGTKAVSGGFDNSDADLEAPDTTLILPHVSRKQGGRRWTVEGTNLGDSEGTLTAYVNCRDGGSLKAKRKSTDLEAGPGEVVIESAVAKCAKRLRVLSGGFEFDDEISGNGPIVLHSKKVGGRKWSTSAVVGSTVETTLTTYAYCEEKKN